ncbi:hypothetical protein, partial [Pseudomonas syringae]|uniref:hypothetical protein n=1 Tax=Pseudomonas syringae TaxID=317 RepID=UPI001E526DC3
VRSYGLRPESKRRTVNSPFATLSGAFLQAPSLSFEGYFRENPRPLAPLYLGFYSPPVAAYQRSGLVARI